MKKSWVARWIAFVFYLFFVLQVKGDERNRLRCTESGLPALLFLFNFTVRKGLPFMFVSLISFTASFRVAFFRAMALFLVTGLLFYFSSFLFAQSHTGVRINEEAYKKEALGYYILGYGNFDFYSSEQEIRDKIVADGWAQPDQIKEEIAEIYSYPDYAQDFVLFNPTTSNFIDFSFSKIPMKDFLRKLVLSDQGHKGAKVGHLSSNNALDFKILTLPRSEVTPLWEIKLYFYRRDLNGTQVYRLFGITLDLKAGDKIGDINVVGRHFIERSLKKIFDKYHDITYRIVKNLDARLSRHYYVYQRAWRTQSFIPKIDEEQREYDKGSQLVTQLNISYLQNNHEYGNFQVTYLATGLLFNLLKNDFTTSTVDYEDFSPESVIDF